MMEGGSTAAGSEPLDVAVIGAGPCGLATGIGVGRLGLSCVLFDRGCVANALVGYPIGMKFFSTTENLEIGQVPFVCAASKPSRDEALTYYRRVSQHFQLDVRQYEEALEIQGKAGAFHLRTRRRSGEKGSYIARSVVVATGYYDTPNPLDVPGEDLAKVTHYYREAHPYFDQDCLVVGGGNSAVETALDLWRAGARVTLVHFLDDFDKSVKPWVRPDIENRVKEGSIQAHFQTRVVGIAPAHVDLRSETDRREVRLANDWVFAMTGYSPDTRLLKAVGVGVDERTGVPTHDPETMETNVPGIFIAGVIAAGFDANRIFIENGRHHGMMIAAAIGNGPAPG